MFLAIFVPGDVPLSSQAEVFVSVVNKAMPVFEEPFYNFSVAENVQPFSAIATVTARSPMGNALVYSIISGDEYGEFGVDYNIGELCFTIYLTVLMCVNRSL